MIMQTTAFLVGLVMLWVLLMRAERSSFWLAVSMLLMLWGIARLLLMWRVLHLGLIVAVPVLVFSLLAWATYRWWRRYQARRATAPEVPPAGPNTLGAATALFLVLSLLALNASAAETSQSAAAPSAAFTNSVSLVSAMLSGEVHDN